MRTLLGPMMVPVPVAHPDVVAIVHAIADGPVTDALLALLQLLQQPEVPRHCATAAGPVLSCVPGTYDATAGLMQGAATGLRAMIDCGR